MTVAGPEKWLIHLRTLGGRIGSTFWKASANRFSLSLSEVMVVSIAESVAEESETF